MVSAVAFIAFILPFDTVAGQYDDYDYGDLDYGYYDEKGRTDPVIHHSHVHGSSGESVSIT